MGSKAKFLGVIVLGIVAGGSIFAISNFSAKWRLFGENPEIINMQKMVQDNAAEVQRQMLSINIDNEGGALPRFSSSLNQG